ncbi:PAS domain S-box protein [Undibacterium sp. Xuan67W]|uniref:PAS domain S-box protein n=1 Tax=Undibacterium sp. Xuan67W TaxID=3413057 RepID=UPI003BF26589
MQNLIYQIKQLEQENAELRRAQTSTQTNQAYFEYFSQQLKTACIILNEHGLILHANQSVADLLGTSIETLLGIPLDAFIFEDQSIFAAQVAGLFEPGRESTCDIRVKGTDGKLTLLRLAIVLIQINDRQTYVGIQFSDISRQQGKQNSVATEEHFTNMVAENVPALVAYWNTGLRCTYANSQYLNWFGRSTAQMCGIHMEELLGKELFAKNFQYIKAVLNGVDQQFERTLTKTNGEISYAWAQYIAHKIDGVVQGFFVLVTDISSLKHAQNALSEIETKNRALVNAIPDLIFLIDRHGQYLEAHIPDTGKMPQSREELLKLKVSDVLPHKIATLYLDAIKQALDSGKLQEFRYAVTQKDRSEMQFEVRLTPCNYDSVIAIIRDITESERERREHELQLSDRLQVRENDVRAIQLSLTMANDIANIGTWIRDLRTEELWASTEWRRLFGYRQDEALSLDMVIERIHPADRRHLKNITSDYVNNRQPRFQAEIRVVLPDLTERWLAVVWQIEFDESDVPLLTRGVAVDISMRKRVELELVQKRIEVMHLARVATMGELSGALAHELNQPLTAILSNAQAAQRFLVRPDLDIQEIAEILQDIVDEDKRAGEIIRRLRRLFEKQSHENQTVDVNQLALEAIRIMRNDMINQGITLLSELQDDLPTIIADPVQLQQVLINLIMNAGEVITGLDSNQRIIEINTQLTQDNRVEVSVNDYGPGVPEVLRSKIFEAFYTSKENGMGLGLSICKSIIEANGGQLWCENHSSHPSTGASFRFRLPINQELTS